MDEALAPAGEELHLDIVDRQYYFTGNGGHGPDKPSRGVVGLQTFDK